MQRAFTNILSRDVNATAEFYQSLLGMTRAHDFGWFVILTHPGVSGFEFGVLDRAHETAPADGAAASTSAGVMVTFVVDDVEACHDRAVALGADIIAPPTDMVYGQRRMLVRDPDGTLVDVSAPVAPAPPRAP